MDILKSVADGCARPTAIMYRSNTSWIILKRNLELLKTSGHIEEIFDGSGPVYAVTDRGIDVLLDFNLVFQAIAAERGSFL